MDKKECVIPYKTNQYYLCCELFRAPFGKPVEEIKIMDLGVWKAGTNRSVYDAVRLLNKRIEKKLDIKEFIKWKKNTVWIDKEFEKM